MTRYVLLHGGDPAEATLEPGEGFIVGWYRWQGDEDGRVAGIGWEAANSDAAAQERAALFE